MFKAVVEERKNILTNEFKGWNVTVYWEGNPEIDSKYVYAWAVKDRKVVSRLEKAINDQAVFEFECVKTNTRGETYPETKFKKGYLLGRHLNTDLRTWYGY